MFFRYGVSCSGGLLGFVFFSMALSHCGFSWWSSIDLNGLYIRSVFYLLGGFYEPVGFQFTITMT